MSKRGASLYLQLGFSVILCLDAQKTVERKLKIRNGIVSQNFGFQKVRPCFGVLFGQQFFFFFFFSKLILSEADRLIFFSMFP